MTQKVFEETHLKGIPKGESGPAAEMPKDETITKTSLHFRRQQESNRRVKEEMARELTAMGFREEDVKNILYLEDELTI